MHRHIRSDDDWHDFTRFAATLSKPFTIEWRLGCDRTLDQNAMQWMWAAEVANQVKDRDAVDVQAEWKLRIGVPILRSDSTKFREIYDVAIKPLTYEQKIDLMKAGFEVTSQMNVRQMIRYLDGVERQCREMGLHLTAPDPDLAKYQDRYRQKDAAA